MTVITNAPLAIAKGTAGVHRASRHPKPNSTAAFTQRLEQQVIPEQTANKGFQDEITFVGPGGTEAFGVSLWDNKESADAYSLGPYADVTTILANLVDGSPQVDTYEVSNATFHKIGATATLKQAGLLVCGERTNNSKLNKRGDATCFFSWRWPDPKPGHSCF
jgi:hypothetical protein